MFNDTYRYLDDIFIIDNLEYEKYPTELQMNKANTSDNATPFLYSNIKVTGSDVHIYDKHDDLRSAIVNFPWLSDVPRRYSYGIYISQLVRFARCCTSVLDFIFKNLHVTSKPLTQDYTYHKLQKKL